MCVPSVCGFGCFGIRNAVQSLLRNSSVHLFREMCVGKCVYENVCSVYVRVCVSYVERGEDSDTFQEKRQKERVQ